MADDLPKKKRKLRAATQTMRERAERETARSIRPGVRGRLGRLWASFAGMPLWRPLKAAGRLGRWKPLRILGKVILPPYIRNSWRELRLVTWPDGKQTRQLTGAVIIFSIIFGALIAAFDYGLDKLFKEVIIR